MQQFCNFFTLRKQQTILFGDGLKQNGKDRINHHTDGQRNAAGKKPAGREITLRHKMRDAAICTEYHHTHNGRGADGTEHIPKDSGCVGKNLCHGNQVQNGDAQIAQQAADGSAQNADLGVAGENEHRNK